MVDEEERRFIQRLVRRDERAFNDLVRAYEQRVFRLVFRMLGRREEAEDMAQEVFVQVFKAIDQFRGDSKLSSWIFRIAVNLCKNRSQYLARRRAGAQDEIDASIEKGAVDPARHVGSHELVQPDQLVLGYEMERVIQRAIQEMEPDFREVLVLRDVENLSYEEITEITGALEGTVKSRLFRARALIREAIERATGERTGR